MAQNYDVFVSYSSKDKTIADAVVAAMEAEGIRCWYAPRDIAPGSDWADSITQAIQDCGIMVLVFSETANRSQRVIDEINFAIDQGKMIIPFRIEPYNPTGALSLHLSSRHWLDAYEPSWDAHLDRLVESVAVNLKGSGNNVQISGRAANAIVDQEEIPQNPIEADANISQEEKPPRKITAGSTLGKVPIWTWAVIAGMAVILGYIAISGLPRFASQPAMTSTVKMAGQDQTTPSQPSTTSTIEMASMAPSPTPSVAPTDEIDPTETDSAPTLTATPLPTPSGTYGINPKDGAVLLYIPPGEFIMGRNDTEADEGPEHTVTLDGYWIYQTEVTNAMWSACTENLDCPLILRMSNPNLYKQGYENHPIVNVSWHDANEYCSNVGGRLPTEAEWEYAAGGATGLDDYPWGSQAPSSELANYGGDVGETTAVGSYPAGVSDVVEIYDMSGNVAEWVADWYDAEYYQKSPANNPSGPETGTNKILRGGGWNSGEDALRITFRQEFFPDFRFGYWGFRCVLPVDAVEPQN